MPARFRDRVEAGQRLARELAEYANRPDVLVLALPRGGVPVAFEVAGALNAPLDVFVVRKLGLPWHEELAMGAIASGGVRLLNRDVIETYGIGRQDVERVTAREQAELERRERRYRGDRPFPDLSGRTVILVDDGLATGSTMRAAVEALRLERPARIVVAVPVSAPETCDAFRDVADAIVCAVTPEPFYAVGLWYEDFSQTSDEEVHDLLARAAKAQPSAAPARGAPGAPVARVGRGETEARTVQERTVQERVVRVAAGRVTLEGNLAVPKDARGVVLFAHGSGSSRHSPRNRLVAEELQTGGLATLLVDLLTADEETVDARTRHLRFDIALLAERLVGAIDWLGGQPETRAFRVGLFGASTGGGAALVAAAERPHAVAAVVSRGGRPDLAGDALPLVRAPTLLLVGEYDEPVIELNELAMARMRAPVALEIVPRATHLFEEPGALEEVARLARGWFARHLAPAGEQSAARRTSARDERAVGGADVAGAP